MFHNILLSFSPDFLKTRTHVKCQTSQRQQKAVMWWGILNVIGPSNRSHFSSYLLFFDQFPTHSGFHFNNHHHHQTFRAVHPVTWGTVHPLLFLGDKWAGSLNWTSDKAWYRFPSSDSKWMITFIPATTIVVYVTSEGNLVTPPGTLPW